MPATYTLISSNVLTSTAASVTFSAIPATYTDLVVRATMRTNDSSTEDQVKFKINNSTSNIYSYRYLGGWGASGVLNDSASNTNPSTSGNLLRAADGNTATSNTFSSVEIYIPSYTVSQNKPFSSFAAQETNATSAFINLQANLFSSTTAVSELNFAPQNGANFLSGSSFYLYGISNA
jgi:hypothetical protein